MKKTLGIVVSFFVVMLSGCGSGNESGGTTELRAQADAAEARALALAPTSVCTRDADCSLISFEDAFPSCTQHRDFPILANAPTRLQAETAAASQRALAREARYAPGVVWGITCAAIVDPYPTPYCEQKQCRLKPNSGIILPGA